MNERTVNLHQIYVLSDLISLRQSLEGGNYSHKRPRTYQRVSWRIPISDCKVYGDVLDADIVEVALLASDRIERRPSRINDCVEFEGIAHLPLAHISSHLHWLTSGRPASDVLKSGSTDTELNVAPRASMSRLYLMGIEQLLVASIALDPQ